MKRGEDARARRDAPRWSGAVLLHARSPGGSRCAPDRIPRERLEPRGAASLTVLDAAGGVLRQDATAAGGRETWVSVDRISPHLVERDAAPPRIAASPSTRGVDPAGIVRALGLDVMRGRAAFGGSTLTMQLARLVDPHPRTLAGKFKRGRRRRPDRADRSGKREILEQYLNRVYYGNGAWGAEAAARFYFGKPAAALSLGEASFLAVLPRGPEVYDPFRHLPLALRRRAHILGEMQDAGMIDGAPRATSPRSTPLVFRRAHPELRAPHFVDHVLAPLARGRSALARPSRRRWTGRCSSAWRSRCAITWRRSAAAASRRPGWSCCATATARSWRWSARATTSTPRTPARSTSRPSCAARARR